LFVKSFPNSEGKLPPPPLTRIGIVALGPVVWNACVLLALFISILIEHMVEWAKFASIMAGFAPILALVGIVAIF
jgi:1,3-beta-glucan synthase